MVEWKGFLGSLYHKVKVEQEGVGEKGYSIYEI